MLERLAGGLALTARALEQDDDELATRRSSRCANCPTTWPSFAACAVPARGSLAAPSSGARTGRSSCARARTPTTSTCSPAAACCSHASRPLCSWPERRALEPSLRGLSEVLAGLASEFGDRETRQRAADRALEVANVVSGADAPAGSTLAVAITGVRMVATDVMVFVGVDLDVAVEAVREGILERQVAAPARPDGDSTGSGDGCRIALSVGERRRFARSTIRPMQRAHGDQNRSSSRLDGSEGAEAAAAAGGGWRARSGRRPSGVRSAVPSARWAIPPTRKS